MSDELSPSSAETSAPGRATFAAPPWLRDLGLTSWFLIGCFALLAGLAWVLGTAETIVGPVIIAMIIATVSMPLVGGMNRHRVPRAAGAALVLVALGIVAGFIVVLVIGGITAQRAEITESANAAAAHGESWLKSLGVDQSGASGASASVKSDVPKIISTLVKGVVSGLQGITSLVFGLSLAGLCTFFLLKDGPSMRRWVDRHLGVPQPVGETITRGVIRSLRGYFRGVTIVAAFNGAVVGLGALVLDVPLAGTIAVVTFVTAYVPFIGAFVAGAFAVVLALGGQGTSTALIMLVIVLLANGLLQNLLQPFAMGSALDLSPFVVLVVTIGSGCLFGMMGLVLAAPLTSAAVHIGRELAAARASTEVKARTPGSEPLPPAPPVHA
jgi:predicted PurR-regulated permease PerM